MEITACNPKEMYNSKFLRFLGLATTYVPPFWKLEVTFCRIDFTLCNPNIDLKVEKLKEIQIHKP